MKKLLTLAAATIAASMVTVSANATTFRFDGINGAAQDAPTNGGNIAFNCGTAGQDFCTANNGEGFDYSKSGISFNATAYAGGSISGESFNRGMASLLIQDLVGGNQGLGVISSTEGNLIGNTLDQINFDTGESIVFSFDEVVTITDILLNDGLSQDCPGGGGEGPCGDVGVIVDGGVIQSFSDFLAMGVLASGGAAAVFVGQTFEFIGLTSGAGYSIEEFRVVPIPGAIPLLLSGLAGLGFAARRKRKTA
ncbi:MAG: hypothetical protein AAGJ73_13025 [Pseudomonadota bacterium]